MEVETKSKIDNYNQVAYDIDNFGQKAKHKIDNGEQKANHKIDNCKQKSKYIDNVDFGQKCNRKHR